LDRGTAYNNQVDPDTAQKILALNRQFYQTFAEPFSNTRMRLQPGVRRILERLQPSENILDLGCGNGTLASQLAQKYPGATYIGLDNSQDLLERARMACAGLQNISFHLADLASPAWEAALATAPEVHASRAFDTILAFAVLHHIPSAQARASLLRKIRLFIQPDGEFIHSEWQFLNNPRLRLRIQAWETIDLSELKVDPGDYLLDWRQGGQGLRYVHHFSEEELAELARESGFAISETFYADGEGGNLGLYQVWLPA
jgi:tRNA (uracil-5-)-methyltransferase TRM9